MNLKNMFIYILLSLYSVAICGSSMSEETKKGIYCQKEGIVKTLPIGVLGKHLLHITEVAGVNQGFLLNEKRFSNYDMLLSYLQRQDNKAFSDGILLTCLTKQIDDKDAIKSLTSFCVNRDIDFFVHVPLSKPVPEKKVYWIVQSINSVYSKGE
jgi:hypothetical protein